VREVDRYPALVHRRLAPLLAIFVGLLVASCIAACGSTGGATPGTSSTRTTRAPLPAGRLPSAISKMVCSTKAQGEIAQALGETAQIETPTWVDHLYACRLVYGPSATLELSVKELSSWSQTYAYYGTLRSQLGNAGSLNGLGQGAFQATSGDVVVRKDWKVLLVNIAELPPQFGQPATPSSDVAVTVADVILGCWAGD
jgi:hypothetical protein